jgi:hypothetical protein
MKHHSNASTNKKSHAYCHHRNAQPASENAKNSDEQNGSLEHAHETMVNAASQ